MLQTVATAPTHGTPRRSAGSAGREQRSAERRRLVLPARLTWKDAAGTTRFTSVTTRDVSEQGVYVECLAPAALRPLRLVHFQLEREARDHAGVPESLREGKVLSAVYRVGRYRSTTGMPDGYALRLLIEPSTRAGVVSARSADRSIA